MSHPGKVQLHMCTYVCVARKIYGLMNMTIKAMNIIIIVMNIIIELLLHAWVSVQYLMVL